MSKTLKKILISSASLIMLASTSAGISNVNTHASTNPNRYGIVVFPTKKTHYNFAYQMRDRGHHSKIFMDNVHSRIGYSVFGAMHHHKLTYSHGAPSTNYASFLRRHYPKIYMKVLHEIEHIKIRHQRIHMHKQVKRNHKQYIKHYNKKLTKKQKTTIKHSHKHIHVIVLNAQYNKAKAHDIINLLHKRYPNLSYRRDIVYTNGHHEQWGYIIGLNDNHATKDFMWKVHQYNYSRISNSYRKSHRGLTHWFNHNVVQQKYRGHNVIPQTIDGDSVIEHYTQKHNHGVKAIEILSATLSQIVGRD